MKKVFPATYVLFILLVSFVLGADAAPAASSGDTAAIEDNRQLHERLMQLGVDHVYREFPGAHTWKYWSDRLPEHMAFHEAAFRK